MQPLNTMSRVPRRHCRILAYILLCVAALYTVQQMTQWVVHMRLSSTAVLMEQKAQKEGDAMVTLANADPTVNNIQREHKETGQQQVLETKKTEKDPAQKVMAEMTTRRQRVEAVCDALAGTDYQKTRKPRMNGVFFNTKHKLAYCYVPKTGCTFWKQTFTFLNQKKQKGESGYYKSPYDIPRLTVHTQTNAYGLPWVKHRDRLLKDHTRFLFARDPYSRLWSSYLDKFYLPDFWLQFGRKVIARRKPAASARTLSCGMNISFPEFIDFAVDVNEPHWAPVSLQCDPCQFKPDIIGIMETYTRDGSLILNQTGLGWILEGHDHRQHVQNELEMLIDYNFRVLDKKSPSLRKNKCITDEQLGQRLWTTFQFNGYLPEDMPYAPPSPFTKQAFRESVIEAFRKSANYSRHRLKAQKQTFMKNAFRQLSKETLLRIAQKYAVDFKMFGYSQRTFV